MKRTAKSMNQEADQLSASLEAGKVKGAKAIQKAKYKIGNLRYRARKKLKSLSDKSADSAKAGQLHLPGILSQLNMVRIEELVAERIAKTMRKQIRLQAEKNAAPVAVKSKKSA